MSMSANLSKPAGASGQMSSGGSGKHRPLRRKKKVGQTAEFNPFNPPKYNRMSFKRSKDPVYIAFDHLDNQPISKLASDFVKDTFTNPIKKMFAAA